MQNLLNNLLGKETFRFLVTGVLNTVVGYSAFYIFYSIVEVNYPASLFISHVIGVLNSFVWNSRWTFNTERVKLANFLRFCIVYAGTFILNLAALSIFVEFFGMEVLFAQLLSLFITTAVSFLGHKYWSFKNRRSYQ